MTSGCKKDNSSNELASLMGTRFQTRERSTLASDSKENWPCDEPLPNEPCQATERSIYSQTSSDSSQKWFVFSTNLLKYNSKMWKWWSKSQETERIYLFVLRWITFMLKQQLLVSPNAWWGSMPREVAGAVPFDSNTMKCTRTNQDKCHTGTYPSTIPS